MFSEAKKTVDYGFRRYRYLLAPYSLHTRARTNILGGLVIDWKLIQQTQTINDKMNYCMGGKFFQVQLRLLCPPDPSGTIKCSPPNKGQDKKYLVIKCLPWNKGRGQSCFVTQLKLYTLDKLSSAIFCCLCVWVSEGSVSPAQISTFFNIYIYIQA